MRAVGLPHPYLGNQLLLLPFRSLTRPGKCLAAGFVRPFLRYVLSSFSVDASVQVHDDIDRRNKDLGGDEDDDWNLKFSIEGLHWCRVPRSR